MIKKNILPLSELSYNKYGYYQNLLYPDGERFDSEYFSFCRDLVAAPCGALGGDISFSVCTVKKRPLVVDVMEIHNNTYEAALPLDGDMLLQVIPASQKGELPANQTEIFLVPKGTLVVLRSGVWHHAPFAYNCDAVNVLVMLPERTYVNDCTVVELGDPVGIIETVK